MRPSRTGGASEGKKTPGTASTPFAYRGDDNVLYWVWNQPDPSGFYIYTAPTRNGPYTQGDTFGPTDRNSDPHAYDGLFVYVQAFGSDGVTVGFPSQVVNMT